MAGTCLNCGKYIPSGSGYYSKKQKSEGRLMATLSVLNHSEDTYPKQGKFCCERCYNEYILTHPEEMSKKEAKASKKEAKKAAAAKKLEDSKVTSDESLEKISHLCLVAGLVGAHRFAVGKFLTGIIMPATAVFGIAMAIANRELQMLSLVAVDIVWWLYDFATIKAKKFTDKYGHTIRN